MTGKNSRKNKPRTHSKPRQRWNGGQGWSFKEKLGIAFQLSLCIAYSDPDVKCAQLRDIDKLLGPEVADNVWGWVDGLTQQYHMRHITGKCSLRAMADYNIDKEEAVVNADIELFMKLLREHGWPSTTFQELEDPVVETETPPACET